MNVRCRVSGREFEITKSDLAFYSSMEVPPPTLHPDERRRRRLAWRNEKYLYKRKCPATGKMILSHFSTDNPFPVYDQQYWWSEKFDAREYGRDFDFNRPFFEQFSELLSTVPVPALSNDYLVLENSDYCNLTGNLKNCYLVFNADFNEDCMYSSCINRCRDVVDSAYILSSELLYQCLDCRNCYNLLYSQDCENCRDSWFLRDCRSCSNCFCCTNLTHKEYYICNKQTTKEEYQKFLAQFNSGSRSVLQNYRMRCSKFNGKQESPDFHGYQNENVSGDHIYNCKNAQHCYDLEECQDMKYCQNLKNGPNSDCYDVDQFGVRVQQLYECSGVGGNAQRIFFSVLSSEQLYDIYYSYFLEGSKYCFGCVGIKRKSYCIFNKQYKKEEYYSLVKRIVKHMKKTGEWGEFFPAELSPFAYNQSLANDFYPLGKDEVKAKGWRWHEDQGAQKSDQKSVSSPNSIDEVKDTILTETLGCEHCGKSFRMVKPELKFYRKLLLPIPSVCPACRREKREKQRNSFTQSLTSYPAVA